MKNRLYPMGPGAILDNTFFILRDRFWKFQGVIFLSYLPVIIISLLLFILFVPTLMNATDIFTGLELGEEAISSFFTSMGGYFVVLFLSLMVAFIIGSIYMTGGVIKLFATGLEGEECGVRQALAVVKGKRWRFIGVFFSLLLLGSAVQILLGLIFNELLDTGAELYSLVSNLVGMALMFLFSLSPVVLFLEDKKTFATLRRAFTLMAGHRWRLAGTYLLVILLAYIIILILYALAILPAVLFIVLGTRYDLIAFYIIGGLLSIAAILLFNVLFLVYQHGPLTCIYYDLLIRKEGYDLSRRMTGQTPASPAPGIPGAPEPRPDGPDGRGLES
ncbi:MAG: hypothetical protein GX036_10915 [Firmicutes bacterium]|nr:hypothetical protein [Bacillota bacterium]